MFAVGNRAWPPVARHGSQRQSTTQTAVTTRKAGALVAAWFVATCVAVSACVVTIGGTAPPLGSVRTPRNQRTGPGMAAASPSGLPSMFCGHRRFRGPAQGMRPGEIGCLSADGSTFLAGAPIGGERGRASLHAKKLRWLRWTSDEARGRGYLWENSCDPDCAVGVYAAYPALIDALRPRNGRFTRLVISATGLPQTGDSAVLTYRLDPRVRQWLGVRATSTPPPPRV